MDLIYTNKNNVELGILQHYDLDLAFGSDENNFELVVASDNNVLEVGSHFYFESTEYGGIVDAIAIDTESSQITYSGRTWHGILAGKVIVPPSKTSYMTVSGEANAAIRKLLTACGLSSFFVVPTTASAFYIDNEQFRYSNLYDSIVTMLAKVNARLEIYRIGRKVYLNAVPLVNYATNEEWDLAHKTFRAESVSTRVNHLICLGKGEMSARKVIHLFADQDGNVQPYATVDEPYRDSQYILTTTNQVLTGANEIVEVYDYSGAETEENYVLTTSKPANWGIKYASYYYEEDGEYKNVEASTTDELKLLTSQPRRWASQYGNYYTSDGKAVEAVVTEDTYENLPQTDTPSVSDWKKNYSKYYYWNTDGTTGQWSQVRGVDVHKYKVQTEVPSNWTDSWGNYYIYWHVMESVVKKEYKDKNGNIKYKIPSWEKNKYYKKTDAGNYTLTKTKPKKWDDECTQYYTFTKSDYVKVNTKYGSRPTWKKKTFYTDVVVSQKAPVWDKLIQYAIKHPASKSAPTWAANTYYKMVSVIVKPTWARDTYYQMFEDHYAALVAGGLEKMEEYKNADSIEMDLPADDIEYFVGDIVGASAEAQGFTVQPQAITKKIVKFNNEGITISYVIGGK